MVLDRFLLPLTFAAGMTFLLFWIMTVLIRTPEVDIVVDPIGGIVTLVDVRTDTPVTVKPPAPPKLPDPIETPEFTPFTPKVDPTITGIPIQAVDPTTRGKRLGQQGPALLDANGDAVPLVRVPPTYPTSALRRSIEGRVLIEFDVGRNGAVASARVIAAEPANIFNAAALKAVEQWRYEPKIVDGRPQMQRGLRIVIPFRLGSDAG